MNVKELLKNLNKVKKKHDDAPVLYVYGNKTEMTFVEIDDVKVMYSKANKEELCEKIFTLEQFEQMEFSKEEKEGYNPYIILTEVNI